MMSWVFIVLIHDKSTMDAASTPGDAEYGTSSWCETWCASIEQGSTAGEETLPVLFTQSAIETVPWWLVFRRHFVRFLQSEVPRLAKRSFFKAVLFFF